MRPTSPPKSKTVQSRQVNDSIQMLHEAHGESHVDFTSL